MNKEQFSNSKPVVGIDAATALAATVTGNAIDTQGFKSVTLVLDIAISAGSVDAISFVESEDNVTFTACDDAVVLYYPDGLPISADAVIHVGCVSKKQYIKPVLTCTAPTGTVGALGLLQDAYQKPDVKESSVVADADIVSPGPLADADTTAPKR